MNTGVYRMYWENTRHFYIGSTSYGFSTRWSKHKNQMRNGDHSQFIQNVFEKYGEPSFSIIEFVTPKKCVEREQYYIDANRPNLNANPIAGSGLGSKRSPEYIARITGRKRSAQSIKNGGIAIKLAWDKRNAKTYEAIRQCFFNGLTRQKTASKLNISLGPILEAEKKLQFKFGRDLDFKGNDTWMAARIGREPPNKGVKFTPEQSLIQSIAQKKRFENPEHLALLRANAKERRAMNEEQDALCLSLLASGLSQTKTAERLGLKSRGPIKNLIKRNKLTEAIAS